MSACTVVALAIDYLRIKPMKVLFITAVINDFLSVPLLAGIMLVANDRKIKGDYFDGRLLNARVNNHYFDDCDRNCPRADVASIAACVI